MFDQHRESLEEVSRLRAEFEARDGESLPHVEDAVRWSSRAAELVIESHRAGQGCLRDAVTLLCRIAAHREPAIARAGLQALFPALVERLNDSFDPAACELYDRVFAQVIDFCRRLPGGGGLDEALRSFGLENEADLLARKSRIRESQISNPESFSSIKKVLLLSRVTIGADVAVTSVAIARLRELLPAAEFVLLGSRKLRELFGGDSRVRVHEIRYERGGGLLGRLMSWIDVIEAVKAEVADLKPGESWVIDPDSRLTQLGLLPLLRDERDYFFFESRGFRREGATHIGQLASRWLDEITGAPGVAFPYVALPAEHRNFGKNICERLRRAGASRLVTISLGVGGNARKRISDEFESELIQRAIADSALILDKGASAEEREQIDRIVATLRAAGKTVVEIDERNLAEMIGRETIDADAITWDGGIGSLAGLIAASDEYIGYDSAGQHIAAALGVPLLTIFVNSNAPTFAERWRPYGAGAIEVLTLDASQIPVDAGEVLFQALSLRARLRGAQ